MKTAGLVRGCGTRHRGGIYAGSELSAFGLPIEYFIVDPPQPIDDLALTPIGVKLIERDGVTHVFDWIGSQHYQNVADFIEETRRFGLSRRLPKTLDFSRLTPRSRIVLVHARAIIKNCGEYYPTTGLQCPKKSQAEKLGHTAAAFVAGRMKPSPEDMCAGLWWHDIESAMPPDKQIDRQMPSFAYSGWPTPNVSPSYQPGIFLSLPITNLQVIRDPIAGTHEQAEAIASQASLPVTTEGE
jgi:hypothetical protein